MSNTSISAAMISVISGSQISRFDPQTFTPDAQELANGVLVFPLNCDSSIFDRCNSTVTVVVTGSDDPISLSNISVNVDHYDTGTHRITGQIK